MVGPPPLALPLPHCRRPVLPRLSFQEAFRVSCPARTDRSLESTGGSSGQRPQFSIEARANYLLSGQRRLGASAGRRLLRCHRASVLRPALRLPNADISIPVWRAYYDLENGCPHWWKCFWPYLAEQPRAGVLAIDLPVTPRFADFLAGRDSELRHVLEHEGVLSRSPASRTSPPPAGGESPRGTARPDRRPVATT